jgi:hypothetical protein
MPNRIQGSEHREHIWRNYYRLALALAEMPPRRAVYRALLDVNGRLCSDKAKVAVPTMRFSSPGRRESAAETLPLFSRTWVIAAIDDNAEMSENVGVPNWPGV